MMADQPKPFAFALRGLYMDTIVERMFHTEDEAERADWINNIEAVRNGLEEAVEDPEMEVCDEKKVTMEDFELLKVLGRGAFGKVVLCREKATRTMYAMKILKKSAVFDKNEVAHTLTENRRQSDTLSSSVSSTPSPPRTDSALSPSMSVGVSFLFILKTKEAKDSQRRERDFTRQKLFVLSGICTRG